MGVLGNRGKCAGACRLPYELVVNSNKEICMDKGYILSPKDLCGLSYIPDLITIGVSSLKIEGRMKTPEYVATVTKIYRKYIDLAYSNNQFVIDEQDKKDLLQVFNRGGFSNGHLDSEPNRSLIFKEKPSNVGVYIGFENEETKYRISELMMGKNNIDYAVNRSACNYWKNER